MLSQAIQPSANERTVPGLLGALVVVGNLKLNHRLPQLLVRARRRVKPSDQHIVVFTRMRMHLIALGEWDNERHAALQEETSAEVRGAQREAEKKGTLHSATIDFPQDVRTMFNDVYEDMPWHLKEQQQAMVDELEAKRRWPS